jgi:hypothetical protein
VATCGLAYWSYVDAARSGVSILLSIGFWAFALVVVPIIAARSRERSAPVMTAVLTLLAYVLLMQDALR